MKKYVITGSIGHISKPLVIGLVKAGHDVRVITSSEEKVAAIEALGAKATVGSLFDSAFVKEAFAGADAVYTMIPPIWQTTNWRASMNEVARNLTEGIKANGIKYVVNLSSIGAHLGEGCGPVDGLADFEKLLNAVDGLNVRHLRPSYFYYNFFNQIGLVKQAGIMGANFGDGNHKLALVHTDDIAKVALETLLSLDFTGNNIRYVYSDARPVQEIANVLSEAAGVKFPWVVFSEKDQKEGLLQAGLSETHAEAFTRMNSAIGSGKMQEEALATSPVAGGIKLEEFAKEFAKAFAPEHA